MNIIVLSGNPKQDGLCQSVIRSAIKGAEAGGAKVTEIRLCDSQLLRCQVCDDGWGTCRDQNICSFGADGFNHIQKIIPQAAVLIFATPVY